MAFKGPNSAGRIVNHGGSGLPWSNPSNASGSDDVRATTPLGGIPSQRMDCTEFGMGVPVGATILGVVVEVEGRNTSGVNVTTEVQLLRNGVLHGQDKSSVSNATSDTVSTFGSPTDLWSAGWTVSEINDSGFGVTVIGSAPIATQDQVDDVRITVYYSGTDQDVAAPVAAVAITPHAPSLSRNVRAVKAQITITPFRPAVALVGSQDVAAPHVDVPITAYNPSVRLASEILAIEAPHVDLAITAFTPALVKVIRAPHAVVPITPYAPAVAPFHIPGRARGGNRQLHHAVGGDRQVATATGGSRQVDRARGGNRGV